MIGGHNNQGATHFLDLDGMRGVLATTVMLYHFGLDSLIAKLTHGGVHNGAWGLCVDFFFTLSGFVLCQSFLRQTPSFKQYAIKRTLRLYPLFIISTLIVLFLGGPPPHWSTAMLVTNLLAVQSLFALDSINFPAWSIPFELVLPGVFVAATLPLSRRPRLALAILALGLTAATYAAWRFTHGMDLQWLRAIGGLTAGAALFLVWRERRGKTPGPSAMVSLLCFILAIAVMALGGVAPWASLAFPALSAAAIWFGAGSKGPFAAAPFQALGRWSYAIYLLHIPVLMAAEWIFGQSRVAGSVPLKLAVILACLLAAALTFKFIETPFIDLGKRLTNRTRIKSS